MNSNLRIFTFTVSTLMLVAAAGCASSNANLEVDAAQQAIDQARAERAADCATDLYEAAETALVNARKLNANGETRAAKAQAAQAQDLAGQAMAASPPGCDETQPPPEEVAEPEMAPQDDSLAAGMLDIRAMLQPIYFDYNDATIREQSKELLSQMAEALLDAPGQRIEVEGHCDVRGSTEYNLHLGERRANAVMRYLLKQGVAADQVSIISYGEERPIDLGVSEEAHQRNRRAELRAL